MDRPDGKHADGNFPDREIREVAPFECSGAVWMKGTAGSAANLEPRSPSLFPDGCFFLPQDWKARKADFK